MVFQVYIYLVIGVYIYVVYKSGYILSTKGDDVATYNPVPEPEIDNLRYCGLSKKKKVESKRVSAYRRKI